MAIELPDPLRQRIGERVLASSSCLPPARWVAPERLHLTVAFLGEVHETRVQALRDVLRPVFAAAPPLRLRLGETGTFPPGRPARVAWIAVEESVGSAGDPDSESNRSSGSAARASTARNRARAEAGPSGLCGIESAVRHAVGPLLEQPLEDRPYHAHVTVARPRRPWGRSAVEAFREGCGDLEAAWDVDRAVLMESRLERSGARYTVVEAYALCGRKV